MVYAVVSVSGSQKSENFRVTDRVLISPFDITAVSQYLWAKVGGRARTMDWLQALYFFSSTRFACEMPRSPRSAHKAPVKRAKIQSFVWELRKPGFCEGGRL